MIRIFNVSISKIEKNKANEIVVQPDAENLLENFEGKLKNRNEEKNENFEKIKSVYSKSGLNKSVGKSSTDLKTSEGELLDNEMPIQTGNLYFS